MEPYKKIYKTDFSYRVRTIAKRPILFSPRKSYELNEIAHLIWKNINGKTNVTALVDMICAMYEEERGVIEKDVLSFMEFLEEIGAIREVSSNEE